MTPTTLTGGAIHSGSCRKFDHDTRDGLIKTWFKRIVCWNDRVRQRQALADLDDRLLTDIGLGRAAAEREANKPFWE